LTRASEASLRSADQRLKVFSIVSLRTGRPLFGDPETVVIAT
jgi:hypothetical protein